MYIIIIFIALMTHFYIKRYEAVLVVVVLLVLVVVGGNVLVVLVVVVEGVVLVLLVSCAGWEGFGECEGCGCCGGIVLVVLDVSVGQCCESCGVALYIIDFIGVSWNLSPLINTRSCFYKNQ